MLLPYLHKDLIEAGCDEAGRGCLAGAVYAAAVILPPGFFITSFISFSVKAVLFVGTPLPKTSLEQTCADYRIAREKGIASRLNDV